MTSLLKKFKLLGIGAMSLMFIVAVTMSSCTPKESAEGTEVEVVEEDSDAGEHAEGEEHPADGEEHPADGEEHPADSTDSEHPEHPDN